MSEEKKPTPSASKQPPVPSGGKQASTGAAKPAKKSKAAAAFRAFTKLGGWFTFLIALLALVASGYLWYAVQYKERLLGTDLRARVDGLAPQINSLQTTDNAMLETLASVLEKQETYRRFLERLTDDLGRNRNDWVIEEVRQLLLLANHRLQLARDIDTAMAALTVADSRLEKLADPTLLDVRKLIVEEITQLETVVRADVPGAALRLLSLADNVDRLPLATRLRFAKEAEPAGTNEPQDTTSRWRQVAREIWSDLLGLVRVRRITASRPPLLPPEQSYFLRENLRLILNGAQIALLQNEAKIYHGHLGKAKGWLEQYFDTEAEAVQNVLAELERLRETTIAPDLPDISASLAALNKRKRARRGP